jgi:hypothetical protein
MAPQATATSRKKAEVGLPAFASITAADIVRAPTVQRSIPLDLLPLLKPFKKSGRLALRIERLPQRAKMSAGRRNSDGSWSLASDELEDLSYLIPSNIQAAHELTIRIMKFDEGAASTLKVIQYPIAAPEDAAPEPSDDEAAICRSTEANDPILRSQLGEMQSLFAVRESELAELRASLERAKEEKAAELEKARAAWEQELKQRLAEVAVRAQADKTRDRAARQSEHDNHVIAQAEARAQERLASQLAQADKLVERRVASERKAWEAEANARFAAEQQKWQAQSEQRIAVEHANWQAQADKRVASERDRLLAEAEQHIAAEREKWLVQADARSAAELENWKIQTEARLEAERKAARAQAGQGTAAEFERLKSDAEQYVTAERRKWQAESDQRITAERDRWLAESEQRLLAERQKWQAEAGQSTGAEIERRYAESEQRHAAERQQWQAEADQRIAVELARQQAETEQRLAAERQTWQAEADQRAAAELHQRRAEIQQNLEAGRRAWQAETEQHLEAERRRSEAEMLVALSKAEERWKADEAERSAAARNEWQLGSARLLAEEADKSNKLRSVLAAETDKSKKLEAALEALVQAKSAPAANGGTQELDRLRAEQALMKATLAEREAELARQQADIQQERDHWRQDKEAALQAAAKSWQAEEAARLDAATAKMRAQSHEALSELTQRCENAEHALAAARKQTSAPAQSDDGYVESLRAEVAELRKALTNQEVELGWARAALDESQPLHLRRAGENLPIGNFEGPAREPEEAEANVGNKRALMRDCLLVIGLVVPLILFYPWIAAYLPEGVTANISSMTGGLLSAGTTTQPAVQPAAAPAAAPVERPTATVAKSVNVRATPAVKGTVVVTLQKNASVVVLEQQGNWTRVEVPAKTAAEKPAQGWVYSTYLDARKTGK